MNFLKKLLSWWRLRRDYYRCPRCGHIFLKKGVKLSGWEDHPYGLHVHCPRCGLVVDKFVK